MSSRWMPSLASGLIVGLTAVVAAASFAALVCAGPLAGAIHQGLALALVAAALNTAVVAATASLPGTVGGTQSLPVAILASASSAMAAQDIAPGASLWVTTVLAIGLTTVVTGVVLLLLGQWRAGRLVRFLPYPVLGGVLAGSGWLLAKGAFGIMLPPDADLAAQWPHVLPGLGWAVLMWGVHRRAPHPTVLLLMLGLGTALFFVVAAIAGRDLAWLQAQGWLLAPPTAAGPVVAPVLHPWQGLSLAQVDWRALSGAVLQLATVPVVTAVALLLNVAALETAARRSLDPDRELRGAGLANLCGGLLGGLPGYAQLGLTVMNLRAGANTRWVGAGAAAVCLLALACGPAALTGLPRPILGALLLYLALLMVSDWIIATWGRLSALDHGVVLLIVAVTAMIGFLPAVLVGLIAALLLFILHYGRIDAVRQALSGAQYHSRVGWPAAQRAWLTQHGDAVCILQLQGFLFFGIADRLLLRARRRLQQAGGEALSHLVLDCRRVTGVDSSAAQSFARLHELLSNHGVNLVVTHPSPAVREQLRHAGLVDSPGSVPQFEDLDHGLEWVEAQRLRQGPSGAGKPLLQQLAAALGSEDAAAQLLQQMQCMRLDAGEVLMAQGAAEDGLYLLESGSLCAQRERANEPPLRLQTMCEAGAVVGEFGFYLGRPRNAAVVALTPSVVYRLTLGHLRLIEQHAPALASALHRWIAGLLAARVAHLGSVVDALEN